MLDLRFVIRTADGSLAAMELSDIDADGQFDFGVFAGASADLLDDSDLQEAAAAIEPNSAAAIMVYENRWAGPFVQALRGAGADLVAAATSRRICSWRRWTHKARGQHESKGEWIMGLLRGVARTAAIAGTATAVSNRVFGRQGNRWAQQEQEQYAQAPQAPQAAPAPAPAAPQKDMVTQLRELADLKNEGVLTDARVRGPEGEDSRGGLTLWVRLPSGSARRRRG